MENNILLTGMKIKIFRNIKHKFIQFWSEEKNRTNLKPIYSGLRPPLWSSGQGSWLQIQRCGFDSRRYQIF
jgi:hypothetical protein